MKAMRLAEIKKNLIKHSIDALIISSIPHVTYVTNYSGFSSVEREAILLITKKKNYLLTDARYTQAVHTIPDFQFVEISGANPLKKALQKIAYKDKITKVGFEGNNVTFEEAKRFKSCFKKLVSLSLHELRRIKENEELEKIKAACQIGDDAFKFILSKIKRDISEKELSWELEKFIKERGAQLSFSTIVAFGKNSATPHHQTSDEKLKLNSIVLLDFGVKVDNYCSDMTRTVFFGKADEKFKKMYDVVFNSQQAAINFLKSSIVYPKSKDNKVSAMETDKIARNYITTNGFPTIPHALGHGIGLEVHEAPSLSPKSKDVLEKGMVFSIEPGIYIPDYGGVRLEDLFTIKNEKLEQLTKSTKSLIQI